MSIRASRVGVAPGTTTLTIGSGGTVNLMGHLGLDRRPAQQDPGVKVRNAYGQLMGGSHFDARPTDFDLAKVYGYLPVHRGWISGKLSTAGDLGACCSGCAVGGPCGLGEEIATESDGKPLDPNQREAVARLVAAKLEAEDKALALRERRSRMLWGAIAGMAAGTTALLAVLQYFKKD